jgi:uncharacterized membrane protein
MKSYDYIIVCKRSNYKLIDGISQLMLFLAMISFASAIRTPINTSGSIALYAIIAGITGWLIYAYFSHRKGGTPYYRLALLAATLGWAFQKDWWWLAIIYFIAAALEKQVKFPLEIAFDEQEIVVNSLPRRHYHWNELTNAVLKDGILTIDLKNNTLIQKEIEDPGSAKTENDFNEFCRNRIQEQQLKQSGQPAA